MKEQETQTPEPISKEQFLNFLDNQEEYWENVFMQAQTKILEIRRTRNKIERLEERGYRITFFTDGKNCFFEARPKEPFGFRKEAEKNE